MASGPLGLSPSTSSTSISSSSSTTTSTTTVIDNGTGAPTAGSGTMAKYKMIKKIGQGNFGVVFLAEWAEDHKVYVVKQIDMAQLSPTERDGAVQETKLLASLRHPYIVGYQESFVEKDLLNIVMQYCDGGDLASRIRAQAAMRAPSASAMVSSSAGSSSSTTSSSMVGVSSTTPIPAGTQLSSPSGGSGEPVHFAEEQILDWFVQIAVALKHCHNHKIIHRDLKSQNVFLTRSNEVRLGDFGIARVLGGTTEMAMTVVGTPYSMSPEVCENKPYSFKSDVWALGCVLYEMCVLKHAFDAHNLLGLVWKIVQESYPPIPPSYSDDLRGLIKLLLQKDPRQRPSIDEILDIPFVRMRLNAQIASKTSLVNNSRKATTLKKGQFKPQALGLTHSTSTPLQQQNQPVAAAAPGGPLGTLAFSGPVGSSNGASTPLHSTMLTSTFGSLHGTLGPLSGTVVGTAASVSNATMGPSGTRRAAAAGNNGGHVPPIMASHNYTGHLPAIDSPNPGEVTEMIEVDDFDDRDEFGPAQGHHSGPILSGPILDESPDQSPSSAHDFNDPSPHGGLLSTAAFGSGSLLVSGGSTRPIAAVAASHNGGGGMNDSMAFSTTTTFRPDSVSAPARDNYTLGGTMMAGSATSAIEEDMEFDDGMPSHVGGHLAGTVRTGAPVNNNGNNNAPSPTTQSTSMSTLSPAMSPTGPQGGTPRAGADGFVLPRLASPRNASDFEMIPKKVSQQQRLADLARRKEAANAQREAELAAARQQNMPPSKRIVASGRGGYPPTTPTAASSSAAATTTSSGYGGNRPQPITAGMKTTDEFPSVPISPHSAPVVIARTSSGTRTGGGTAPSTPSHMSSSGLVYANPNGGSSTGPSPKKMFDSRPNTTARHPAVAAAQASNDPNRHRSAGSSRTGPRGSLSGASGATSGSSNGGGNGGNLPASALPSPSSGRLPATRTTRSPSWENTPIRSSGRYVYPDEQAYNRGNDGYGNNGNNHHPELYDTMGSSSEYAADFEAEEHYADPSVQEAQDQLAAMQRAARHTALVPVKGAAPITPHSQPVPAFGFDDNNGNGNSNNGNGMPTPNISSREEKVLTPFETKCAAMKTKVLKSISESQFEEIYKHFAEGFDGRSGITKQQLIDKWHLKDDVLMNIEQMVYMDAMRPTNNASKPSLPSSAPTPKSGPVQSPTRISPPTPSRGDRNPANNGQVNNNNGILGPSPTRPGTHARTSVSGNGARPASGQPVRVAAEIPSRDNIPVGATSPPPADYGSPDDRPIRRSTSTEYQPNGSAVFTFGAIPGSSAPSSSSGSGSSGSGSTSSSRSNPEDRPLGTARGTGAVRKGTGTGGGSVAAKKKSTIATASDRSLFTSSGAIGNDRKSGSSSSSSSGGGGGGSDSATSSLRGPSARRKPALDTGAGHR